MSAKTAKTVSVVGIDIGKIGELLHSSRNCDLCAPRSCDAWANETPRSLIRRKASSLNSRVNFRLCMTHVRSHCHTKLGVFGTGCRPMRRFMMQIPP